MSGSVADVLAHSARSGTGSAPGSAPGHLPSGPILFARYAYPPNALGFCGPADSEGLFGAASAAPSDRLIGELARQFEGAWPYLQLIAGCSHIDDPLDARVVEAYWIGNALLDRVPPTALMGSLSDRFRARAGARIDPIAAAVPPGGVAHHSFHVFAVYPWLGLLRAGMDVAPMTVLDRCRIRWGVVESVTGDAVVVRSRGLAFDGHRIGLGEERTEEARRAIAGSAMVPCIGTGDVVSLHWDWVCDKLDADSLRRLVGYTARNLRAVNRLPSPGPAVVCEV